MFFQSLKSLHKIDLGELPSMPPALTPGFSLITPTHSYPPGDLSVYSLWLGCSAPEPFHSGSFSGASYYFLPEASLRVE